MNALTQAIEDRRASGRRAFGIYLIPGFPDWPTSIAAVGAAAEMGVTFVEFPVISEPGWSDRTGSLIATALGDVLTRPDRAARRAWLSEVGIGVGIVYRSGWPAPGEWTMDGEETAGLLLEHDVADIAAYARVADSRGTCLIPAVDATRAGLSHAERMALGVGGGFVYAAMGRRTGFLDAAGAQVAAAAAAVRSERPDLPVCCAFGLSTPEDVKRVASECDGVVVGSAALESLSRGLDQFRGWLDGMLAAA